MRSVPDLKIKVAPYFIMQNNTVKLQHQWVNILYANNSVSQLLANSHYIPHTQEHYDYKCMAKVSEVAVISRTNAITPWASCTDSASGTNWDCHGLTWRHPHRRQCSVSCRWILDPHQQSLSPTNSYITISDGETQHFWLHRRHLYTTIMKTLTN